MYNDDVHPFTAPYPTSIEELLVQTRCNVDELLQAELLYANEVVAALLVTAHDAVHHVAQALQHGGHVPRETRERLVNATHARIEALLNGRHRLGIAAVR